MARVVRMNCVVPEVVDVRATEVGVGGKGVQGIGPSGAEGAKVHLSSGAAAAARVGQPERLG